MLLFIAHGRITPHEVRCRFYGTCAVTAALLNGVQLQSLTEVCLLSIISPIYTICYLHLLLQIICMNFQHFSILFLFQEGQFVLSFGPLQPGRNELDIYTVKAPTSRVRRL